MYKFIFLLALASFIACNPPKSAENAASAIPNEEPQPAPSVPEMTQYKGDLRPEITQKLLTEYFTLKDALVANTPKPASKAAGVMVQLLNSTPQDSIVNQILEQLSYIQAATDIEVQRKAFRPVSDQLYAIAKSQGGNSFPIYRQYCPMAFNNQGAHWLSKDSLIRNPYFGDMMLTCGAVRDKF